MATQSREKRFHGRVEYAHSCSCAQPGCEGPGEFRAPGPRRPDFDGPGEWQFFCLDHVREFNAGYNFFTGMTPEEISEAQSPIAGWERETRAFAGTGPATNPWRDFVDPLDVLGTRFQRSAAGGPPAGTESRVSEEEKRALGVLGLGPDSDQRAIRRRYRELVRRFHPDRNGGDRRHEKALQAVIEAYSALKDRPAFARADG